MMMSESERRVSAKALRGLGARRLAATLLALATLGTLAAAEATPAPNEDAEPDDESDFAPFAVVVDRGGGDATRYCGGSLVSLRTALTSAWCARGPELSALAAASVPAVAASYKDGVRRVARVAFATEHGAPPPGEMDDFEAALDDAWGGASLDLALLELEAPFGPSVSARPILMATEDTDCGVPSACHAAGVRARGSHPLLRIVDLERAHDDTCAERAQHWAAVRDMALCFVGTQLCPSDRGAGVVCSGKLCGVLSRSAGSASCGDTHAAQSVARWRRFLQCAHTQRACGREGECVQLCTERRLLPEAGPKGGAAGVLPRPSPAPPAHLRPQPPRPAASTPAPPPPPADDDELPAPPAPHTLPAPSAAALRRTSPQPETTPGATTTSATRATLTTLKTKSKGGSRKSKGGRVHTPPPGAPSRSAPPATEAPRSATLPPATAAPRGATLPPGSSPLPVPPRMEFDPSRADFKAGEYGDNAADYAGGADEPGSSSTRAAGGPPPLAPTHSPPPQSARAAPPSAEQRAAPQRAGDSRAPTFALVSQADDTHPAKKSASRHTHLLYFTFSIFHILVFIIYIVF